MGPRAIGHEDGGEQSKFSCRVSQWLKFRHIFGKENWMLEKAKTNSGRVRKPEIDLENMSEKTNYPGRQLEER